jgi:hypothetical protein
MRRDSLDELTCAGELHRRKLTLANTIFKLAGLERECGPSRRGTQTTPPCSIRREMLPSAPALRVG